jgi:hypothetical protein
MDYPAVHILCTSKGAQYREFEQKIRSGCAATLLEAQTGANPGGHWFDEGWLPPGLSSITAQLSDFFSPTNRTHSKLLQ